MTQSQRSQHLLFEKPFEPGASATSKPCSVFTTDQFILRMANDSDAASILDYFERNRDHFAPTDPPKPKAFHTAEYPFISGQWRDHVLTAKTNENWHSDFDCNSNRKAGPE